MRIRWLFHLVVCLCISHGSVAYSGESTSSMDGLVYNPGQLQPVDSQLRVKVGDTAPDFVLPSISGKKVRLSDFKGTTNVVLSFVPAAWTPVCSDQWPGYNIVEDIFKNNSAILLGITVDSIPTLFAWTKGMGELWFEVLSDFWPHGNVAHEYGILRSDGTAERALVFINTRGIITAIHVSDINIRPSLDYIVGELEKM